MSDSKARRGPYAKTQQRREQILDSALEVFAISGYRSGSVREIAERAGITDTGVLFHFASKSALLEAVLERRDRHGFDVVPIDPHDGLPTIRGLVDLARINASQPRVVELFVALSGEATDPDHPAHEYFRRRYERVLANIEQALRLLGRDGFLEPEVDPANAAQNVVALMDGLQVQWLLDPERVDMASRLSDFLQSLVMGVEVSPSRTESVERRTA